jgi:hypothetical protein
MALTLRADGSFSPRFPSGSRFPFLETLGIRDIAKAFDFRSDFPELRNCKVWKVLSNLRKAFLRTMKKLHTLLGVRLEL